MAVFEIWNGQEWIALEGREHPDEPGSPGISAAAEIIYEVFEIVSADNEDSTFSYKNEKGEIKTGELTLDGFQVFAIEKGMYIRGRNWIECIINDVLHRSPATGGLEELDETRIALTAPEPEGTKIVIKWLKQYIVDKPLTPTTGISVSPEEPDSPNFGDFWVDTNE